MYVLARNTLFKISWAPFNHQQYDAVQSPFH